MIADYKKLLKNWFLLTNSYKEDFVNPFLLSSGIESPYYVDCRMVMSYPYMRNQIGEMVKLLLMERNFDCAGGLESGAISVAQMVSDATQVPSFYVRKKLRTHGAGKLIEGVCCPNDRALIVDDVFTTGASIAAAAEASRTAGMTVTDAFVIVDRSNWTDRFIFGKTHGIVVHSLITIEELRSL